ncbi:hypothetical protein RRG08_020082 [Elysia crispata]|uniref:Uncharacterized protein n=1 Tax=Elysia crispata TaxID=231223 RepID=A0AAE1DSY3_9GAST|nr:hypothetical protein RRG08_020082 [Elysia crispata]
MFEACDSNGYIIRILLYSGKEFEVGGDEGLAFGVVDKLLRDWYTMKMLSQLVGPILKLLSCNIVSFFSKTRKRGIAGCAAAAQRIKRAAREEADPALVTDQLARTQRSATSASH